MADPVAAAPSAWALPLPMRALLLLGLGLGTAGLLVWGSAQGPLGTTGRQLAAVLAATAAGAAAVLWVLLDRRFESLGLVWVLALALLLRLVAVQAAPLLEDDHWRYLWDGLRTATALDPYRLPPSAFFGDSTLTPAWQAVLSGINNPDIPTIYGPVLQGLFAAAHALTPARVGGLQALLLLLDLLLLGLMARLGAPRRALLVYALHPLVLKEAMASAHPDGLLSLLLLLALLAWQRRRALLLGLAMGTALCTKVAALVVLPGLLLPLRGRSWRWGAAVLSGTAVAVALFYLPFWWGGGSDAAALGTFGREWRFNPLLYRAVEALLPPGAARPAAALLIAAGVLGLVWRWQRRPQAAQDPPPLDLALLLLLLLSPVLNPWYWLWLLPLALLRGQGWLAAATLAAPLAHLNSTVLGEAGLVPLGLSASPYAVIGPATALQVLALGAAWWWRRRLAL